MTIKVFWRDPYLSRLDTRVTAVAGNDVLVSETIFYALSGGQESDHGTIDDRLVLEARKVGKEIVYTLEDANGVKVRDQVVMRIDWNRRYKLMRLHFAAEIALELVYRKLESVEKIGAHIAQDKARVDFRWHENISPLFPSLIRDTNRIVEANQDIVSGFSDEASERRYWEISDFGRVPCGGTHLRRTGEIGEVQLKRKNIGKGKERIELYVS